ncbi:hypothetical protein CEXT_115511 [Caerostris extrusa]|uniref:Uncharacterized protein n=1 Tax=Caerostris extrusa TaxID=172846 RepID=A0AAV4TP77_CAEEX|nr:hypothetical protein CEXT_115511 [Caerostris extrusa]
MIRAHYHCKIQQETGWVLFSSYIVVQHERSSATHLLSLTATSHHNIVLVPGCRCRGSDFFVHGTRRSNINMRIFRFIAFVSLFDFKCSLRIIQQRKLYTFCDISISIAFIYLKCGCVRMCIVLENVMSIV